MKRVRHIRLINPFRGATLGFNRRSYDRRVFREKAFAVLTDSNPAVENPKVGSIVDISQEGLAFEYIGGDNTSGGNSLLDIFLLGNGIHLYDFSCKIVYDRGIYIPHVDNELASILTTRRCGIKFARLSRLKSEQLRLFIECNAYYPDHETSSPQR